MNKEKWYVVLKGRTPGIYSNWDDAKAQVFGFPGPVYRSFTVKAQAEAAWKNKRLPPVENTGANTSDDKKNSGNRSLPYPSGNFVVVDAACSGVPGPTEYQGFLMPEKKLLFSIKVGWATNNIGEFLGIVHALAALYKAGSGLPIYSDSATAISWVSKRKVKSELKRDSATENAWELTDRALVWLASHQFTNRIIKWETTQWGENPADFGRK